MSRAAGLASMIAASILGLAPAVAGPLLDRTLPRGKDVCYARSGAVPAASGMRLVRLTRPERFRSLDGRDSRIVRIVINFAGSNGARFEDSASCEEDGNRLRCGVSSCDGAEFFIRSTPDGLILDQGTGRTPFIWACGDDSVRNIVIRDADREIPLRRGTGSCLN